MSVGENQSTSRKSCPVVPHDLLQMLHVSAYVYAARKEDLAECDYVERVFLCVICTKLETYIQYNPCRTQ
jgi:hypothetical protein